MAIQILSQPSPVVPTPFSDAPLTPDDIPALFGQQDAAEGEICCPEMYFIRRSDLVAYCQGYASVTPDNDTVRHFLADEPQLVAPMVSLA